MLTSWTSLGLLSVGIGLLGIVILYSFNSAKPSSRWEPEPAKFVDTKTSKQTSYVSISKSKATKYLSAIVPAFKEELRLSTMLDETIDYFKARQEKDASFTWEIIIVDDGSPDKTSEIALGYVQKEGSDNVRLLQLEANVGKGGAVRRGMMFARGERLLMVDADGATRISDLERLEDRLNKVEKNGFGVAIGSRAHLVSTDAVVKRTFLRNFLMWGFHLLVSNLAVRDIQDTQCGFKLFTRKSALALFPNLHIERWAFDIEILYLAQRYQIPIAEVAVNWQEIEGSKLDPMSASIQIGRDLLRIRLNYLFGRWHHQRA